ncbi:MAG: TauD/TfdA family dioxygenase [Planctomycetaceae bacterium]|nr:MAG: TauD/TfdA family dioxygenase [Planctomycetaceae bacterium]
MLSVLPLLAEELIVGNPLPLVLRPEAGTPSHSDNLARLVAERKDLLYSELYVHGGLLFRGFDVADEGDFQRVARAFLGELKPYIEGQSPRTKVGDNVYTSTEFPAQFRVTLHNELSYTRNPPPWILFYCHTPATVRGETPILDCRRAYEQMPADIRERFESLGVRYVKHMHGSSLGMGKSWKDHFETSDVGTVESYLAANDIQWEWLEDGTLRTIARRPGVIRHPVTGETHWFNQANLFHVSNFEPRHRERLLRLFGEDRLPTHAYYGDGSKISDEEIEVVRNVLWNESVFFPWEHGDVLILDNYLTAHGRNSYEGPRRILVAMG